MKKLKSICFIVSAAIIGFALIGCLGTEAQTQKTEIFTGEIITSNERGKNDDGYDYEFWRSSDNVSGKMTLGEDGAFSCEWGGGGNILFRTGKRYNATQPHSAYGDFSIKYSAKYNPGTSGVSYLSVYGWTRNPLVEYYIVENYAGSYHPGSSGTKKGTFTIDGEGTYEVFSRDMKQQPAIAGPGKYDFVQYISVRTQKRTSGTISVTRHFEEWDKLGLDMSGGLYEVMMKVEGYNSIGTAVLTENTLIIR
ncbi:MAG: glycoside hydrolase family 11 protein [Treponema sp.]|jgi:endo-1,4-beta-xylanase|nr:glycoside hydrolase family 11 protein [Treponema sp.]